MTKIVHDVFNEMNFDVFQFKLLKDNFSYIISSGSDAIVIDPGTPNLILEALTENNLTLKACLITHPHLEHLSGINVIKKEKDCLVIGPKHPDLKEIIDQDATDGDELLIGPFAVQVLSSPDYMPHHLFYYLPDCLVLFCGDIPLLPGPGKHYEGDERQHFQSLQRLKNLPPKTRIFPSHDYPGEATATFSILEDELKINPFLAAKNLDEFLQLLKREP